MSTMKVVALPSFTLFYTDLEAPQDTCHVEQNRKYTRRHSYVFSNVYLGRVLKRVSALLLFWDRRRIITAVTA